MAWRQVPVVASERSMTVLLAVGLRTPSEPSLETLRVAVAATTPESRRPAARSLVFIMDQGLGVVFSMLTSSDRASTGGPVKGRIVNVLTSSEIASRLPSPRLY